MRTSTCCLLVIGCLFAVTASVKADDPSFLNTLHHVSTLASTVPANGDVNPYGVAVVPVSAGTLVANNVLVSNFNNCASPLFQSVCNKLT